MSDKRVQNQLLRPCSKLERNSTVLRLQINRLVFKRLDQTILFDNVAKVNVAVEPNDLPVAAVLGVLDDNELHVLHTVAHTKNAEDEDGCREVPECEEKQEDDHCPEEVRFAAAESGFVEVVVVDGHVAGPERINEHKFKSKESSTLQS